MATPMKSFAKGRVSLHSNIRIEGWQRIALKIHTWLKLLLKADLDAKSMYVEMSGDWELSHLIASFCV